MQHPGRNNCATCCARQLPHQVQCRCCPAGQQPATLLTWQHTDSTSRSRGGQLATAATKPSSARLPQKFASSTLRPGQSRHSCCRLPQPLTSSRLTRLLLSSRPSRLLQEPRVRLDTFTWCSGYSADTHDTQHMTCLLDMCTASGSGPLGQPVFSHACMLSLLHNVQRRVQRRGNPLSTRHPGQPTMTTTTACCFPLG